MIEFVKLTLYPGHRGASLRRFWCSKSHFAIVRDRDKCWLRLEVGDDETIELAVSFEQFDLLAVQTDRCLAQTRRFPPTVDLPMIAVLVSKRLYSASRRWPER